MQDLTIIIKIWAWKQYSWTWKRAKQMDHKNLFLTLSQRSLDKHGALQNLSIYYMWKNIGKQYKIINLKQ